MIFTSGFSPDHTGLCSRLPKTTQREKNQRTYQKSIQCTNFTGILKSSTHFSPLTHSAEDDIIVFPIFQRCVEEVSIQLLIPYGEVEFCSQTTELYLGRDVASVTSLLREEPWTYRRAAVKQHHALEWYHEHLIHTEQADTHTKKIIHSN